ncbi:MAG: response regulator [Asticcacaulis sp.]
MSLSSRLLPHLPFLRRYCRALTGTQSNGDALVAATLEALIARPDQIGEADDVRISLYRLCQTLLQAGRITLSQTPTDVMTPPQARLNALPALHRQALLLNTLEGFSLREVSDILGISLSESESLVARALEEIAKQHAARILIIEDETIIALDLCDIVSGLGHVVVGQARTASDAVSKARSERPDLILADIQLADGSSGIDAVSDIIRDASIPVIFVTAFPERLLTGERPEPAFLITKPFRPDVVRAAISQALLFAQPVTTVTA